MAMDTSGNFPFDYTDWHVANIAKIERSPKRFSGDEIHRFQNDPMAKQLQALKDAESEFIPSSGALVKADLYVNDPNSPTKSSRAKVPADALQWLLDKLATQGINFEELERLQNSAAADIANEFLSGVRQRPQSEEPPYQGETLF